MMEPCPNIPQLTVTVLKDPEAFREIKAEWNSLLQESEANNVFLSWEWMHTWWEIYGRNYQLHTIAVRTPSGELVGIAPLKMAERGIQAIHKSQVLEFIGWGGDVTTEYLDIIARKGWEKSVFNSIAEHLFRNNTWTELDLHHFSSASAFIPFMKEYLEQRGLPCRIEKSSVCPIVVLPETWETFLSGKSPNFRKKSKEYRRTSQRDLDVRLVCCDSQATLDEHMDDLRDLHLKRWGWDSRAFRTSEYITFHRKVSGLFLQNGWLRLFFLKQQGKTLAGIYCFHYNNRYYYYQSGRDKEYSKHRLGMVLLNEVLKEKGLFAVK